MSVFERVRNVQSFRDCRDEVIPRKVMGKILEAGRHAPSPGNVDTTEFIVVESREKKEIVERLTGDKRVMEAPDIVLVISDIHRMRRRVHDQAEENCRSEAACAIQNMRLVAGEEGIASCWIGGFDDERMSSAFGVPEGKKVMGAVVFAYTDNPVEPSSKFDLNEICFYDEYDNQIESFWDQISWRGVEEEKKIVGKRARSFFESMRRKL